MGKIAAIVISNATREFDKEYHYIVPEELVEKVKSGMRVIVPFGRSDKPREAFVFETFESEGLEGLKEIKKIIDEKPILTNDMIQLCRWMKQRYICTFFDVIHCMLPPGIGVNSLRIVKLLKNDIQLKTNAVKIINILEECGNECEYEELRSKSTSKSFSKQIKELEVLGMIHIFEEYTTRVSEKTIRVAYLKLPREEIISEIEGNRIKKIQQIRVLEILLDNEYISVPDIVRFAAVSPSVLDTLKKYGFIEFKDIEVLRNPFKNKYYERTEALIPTKQQERVIQYLKSELDKSVFSETLLHGVTGSGKTEVYLQMIQYCFDKGGQAIMMVPEISLTPQMVERFKGRFGESVAVLHSRLSLGERYDQWRLIRDGKIKVVVGARSAVFAPFDKLGMIIIDEEHENTYKSETTPKYLAAEVARQRCISNNALLLYGSATPAIETYFKALNGKIGFMPMTQRANNMKMPQVEIIDMRNELEEGNRTIFSRILSDEININIKKKEQTILFLNKRGHSSFVFCRSCGFVLKCQNCNVSLTYHAHDERLICHYCGYTTKSPVICPKCKSGYIKHFGTGTQKVEEDLKKHFSDSTVVRMDLDTTTGKNSHEDLLRNFKDNSINILLGTQMIAKGHDFPKVTLVGVLAADSLLNSGDYRATERTFQLLTQVAGRAGRAELPGRVVVQTYNTEDFSIVAACSHNYEAFYAQEIMLRQKMGYPPFSNIAVIILNGTYDKMVFIKAKIVKDNIVTLIDENNEDMQVLGPARSPLSKMKSRYRWRIIIKGASMEKLTDILTKISDIYYKEKSKDNIDLSVDINPVNML